MTPVYVVDNSGQLGNKLMLFINVYAYALEYDLKMIHMYFPEEKFFTMKCDSPERIDIRNGNKAFDLATKIGKRIYMMMRGGGYRKIDYRRYEEPANKKFLIVESWYFRMPDLIIKHRNEILQCLEVKTEYKSYADCLFNDNNLSDYTKVAVHLRRGDYRVYENGKYYFDDTKYAAWMRQLQESSKQPVAFVIFSNEAIDLEYFKGQLSSSKVCISKGTPIEDLYGMSLCDYVMGPMSTFSWWGAFSGNNRLLHLNAQMTNISFDDFKPGWLNKE